MNEATGRRRAILGMAAMVASLGAAPRAMAEDIVARGSFERTLKVTGPVDLEVKTGWGRITVRAGDSSTVRVAGTIQVRHETRTAAEEKVRRLEASPPIVQEGNTIRIGEIEDRELREHVGISYDLVVPAETKLRAESGSGSQSIEGIRGPLEAHTGSGSLTLSRIGSETRASTGSGSIEVNGVKGTLWANTGSGSIHGSGLGGAISASTGSGNVTLEQSAAGDVEVHTGSGGVEIQGLRGGLRVRTGSGSITAEGGPKSDWSLHTASGSVTVKLAGDAAFEVSARTSSGQIRSDHPITVQGSISPRELRGKVRGGGVLLDLSTSSGNIRIL